MPLWQTMTSLPYLTRHLLHSLTGPPTHPRTIRPTPQPQIPNPNCKKWRNTRTFSLRRPLNPLSPPKHLHNGRAPPPAPPPPAPPSACRPPMRGQGAACCPPTPPGAPPPPGRPRPLAQQGRPSACRSASGQRFAFRCFGFRVSGCKLLDGVDIAGGLCMPDTSGMRWRAVRVNG